jgi:tetratricopeptide (TPR) repeat protein
MATQKVTKKELQEPDFLQRVLERVMQFAREYRKALYISSISVVGLALIIAGWFLFRMNLESKAQSLYLKTYDNYLKAQPQTRDAEAIKGYQELVKAYPSSKAAHIALYRLGNLFFQAQRYDDAIQFYEKFIEQSSPEGELIVLALSGLALSQEEKKNYSGALASLERAIKMKSGVLFEGILFRDMARMYEQLNDKKNALEYYRKALSATKDPSIAMLLKRKIAMLS